MASYGIGNKGQTDLDMARKLKQHILAVEQAQADIAGVENAAQSYVGSFDQMPGILNQAQQSGLYEMNRLAGRQFAAAAGRGGASNVTASAGAGATTSQMAGQMGTFMSDIAAQRAQAAMQGAQAKYQTQADLWGMRQDAAAAGVDAGQAYFETDIGNVLQNAGKLALQEEARNIIASNTGDNIINALEAFLASLNAGDRLEAQKQITAVAGQLGHSITFDEAGNMYSVIIG